jgi:hypothetical protein
MPLQVRKRYDAEHAQFLAEEAIREKQDRLKASRKRPADRYLHLYLHSHLYLYLHLCICVFFRINRLVSERTCRTPGEEAILDELLRDDSSDAISVEEEAMVEAAAARPEKLPPSFVKFENVGFRTNGSFVVKDEIVSPSFTVPPSLPSLQVTNTIYKPQNIRFAAAGEGEAGCGVRRPVFERGGGLTCCSW